ncbi:MAG TPA: UvrD-helicase domain-containing protein [Bryobacteraceae bacterium]|nr:UvrD-helicase domain-containing protein [Bryobacteraceae bacterium]
MNPAPYPQTDADARERIRTSLDESLIVEASAGTGKTTELVRRIVAVLASGKTTIDKIAAVTFTNKAAGELKLRLRAELDQERRAAPALEDALQRLEEASIGTIHSFCAQILRERPVEARVDPSFEELNEAQSQRLYQRSFRAWLEKGLAASSPGLRRAFARLAWRDSWDDTPPIEQLQFAGKKLVEWRDYPAPWSREPFSRDEEIRTLTRMARELAAMSARPRRVNDNLYRGLAPARHFAGWIDKAEAAGTLDFDALEALLLKLGRDLRRDLKKGSGEYGGGVPREDLVLRRDELLRWIEEFRRRADADLAAELREEMRALVDEYTERKRRAGKLDFVDLLIAVRDLVRDNADVRHYLQDRFTHLFVDEFQDTDPLQAEILLLISSSDRDETDWDKITPSPGKLFLVGDPKQSIYKFRRADIVLYRRIRDTLTERGVGFTRLTRSFRSVRSIQKFVNAAFETEMTGNAASGQADWAPLEEHRPDPVDRPGVVVLPVPRPYKSRLSKEAVNQCLPDTIAAFIAWLVNDSCWGFRARDVAVLFRRRTQGGNDLTRDYARALEARDIPHLLAGSKSFHRREEVETLRAGLAAIEWPDDELNVFATLKGSLFAVRDEVLLRYRHEHGRLKPLFARPSKPADEDFAPVEEALLLLGELHRARNRRPFAATVNALLEATRAHAGFVLRPGGNQILANVARVADLARGYEMSGGISFRGFVDELAAQAEKEEAAEAPVLEEDSDGVRLLTVHGAKGLEFPVVILADITANVAARDPDQYVDSKLRLCATRLLRCAPRELVDHEPEEAAREQAEGIRVAYVAATRAKDLLVVPAVGDAPFPDGGWLSPLNRAVYPSHSDWRKSQPAPGCPAFGAASVLQRPLEYDREGEISVKPGRLRPEHGDHEVVWWDPSKLALNVEGGLGFHQATILSDDGGGSLAGYRTWATNRARVIEAASVPKREVFIASQAAEAPPGEPILVETASVVKAARAASGRRFGTLVHNVMRDVPLDADPAAIRSLVDWNARVLGAPDDERAAAVDAVSGALTHSLLDRARAAQSCHREYPLVLALDGSRVLEGVIDLAFVENAEWQIVDFKTDADATDRKSQYERQLQWYAFALARLTNLPARAWLLQI